jgi:hypothetical protein
MPVMTVFQERIAVVPATCRDDGAGLSVVDRAAEIAQAHADGDDQGETQS